MPDVERRNKGAMEASTIQGLLRHAVVPGVELELPSSWDVRKPMKTPLLAMLSVLTVVGVASADGSAPPDATLTASGGEAMARRNPFLPFRPAPVGKPLPSGSELQCEQGCTVKTSDGVDLELDPGSELAMGLLTFVPLDRGEAALGYRVELRKGSMVVTVPARKRRPPVLLVETSKGTVTAVRPGRARVVVRGERTGVASLQGDVRVSAAHASVELVANQATAVTASNPPEHPRPLAPAPRCWAARGEGIKFGQVAVVMGDGRGAVSAQWEPVANASGYYVELATDPTFAKTIAVASAVPSESAFVSPQLPPGRYFVRVRAVDTDGLLGFASNATALRVVSLALPDGAYSEGQTVFLQPEKRLAISDADGLELATDEGRFVPAPVAIVMDQQPEHALRVRLAREFGKDARVTLRRPALHAEVKLGPKNATWPVDPVRIAITVSDPSGHADVSRVEPQFEVLVGTTEVPVTWSHTGTTWSGVVAPRSDPGPSIVRVIARDAAGNFLGRNFLEVAGPPVPLKNEIAYSKRFASR